MTDLELKHNMCRVMGERESFTMATITARLKELGWLPEDVSSKLGPGVYSRVYKRCRRRVGNLLSTCPELFEHVGGRGGVARDYRLACSLGGCIAKLRDEELGEEREPSPTQWERLLNDCLGRAGAAR